MDKYTTYRDRLRILLILYFFSDSYKNDLYPERVKVFKTELRIQKIDFLFRYPSYLCYELLEMVKESKIEITAVKAIVKEIFNSEEPIFRTEEMMRFFYGAWEDLNDIISFLKSINFIDYEAQKDTLLRNTSKYYYLKKNANEKIESELIRLSSLSWYFIRCQIIKKYFGDFSGNELKIMQYKNETYSNSNSLLGEKIEDIENQVRVYYQQLFDEQI